MNTCQIDIQKFSSILNKTELCVFSVVKRDFTLLLCEIVFTFFYYVLMYANNFPYLSHTFSLSNRENTANYTHVAKMLMAIKLAISVAYIFIPWWGLYAPLCCRRHYCWCCCHIFLFCSNAIIDIEWHPIFISTW